MTYFWKAEFKSEFIRLDIVLMNERSRRVEHDNARSEWTAKRAGQRIRKMRQAADFLPARSDDPRSTDVIGRESGGVSFFFAKKGTIKIY